MTESVLFGYRVRRVLFGYRVQRGRGQQAVCAHRIFGDGRQGSFGPVRVLKLY